MSMPNNLELTLNEILHVIKPSKNDWETRTRIIDELRCVISTIESLRGATVEPFGSFLSQLYTRWGDLDISIELSNGSYISTAARKHKQTLLREVLKALRKTGAFMRLQNVVHARVPILKLESRYQNISCDISINNLSGHVKSKFLLWISLIDNRFRDMVLLVKEWAKANDINNPRMGTLNSYSLLLLVVFHFQTCVPAILPPLKDIYPGNVVNELIGVRADVERHFEDVSMANISKFREERRINHSSLSELFISFFAKFSNIIQRETDQGICTYTGQWEDISTNTRWLPRAYAIFIEDPFEQPENAARAVNSGQLTRIDAAFLDTYHRLVTPNLDRNSLIPCLLRHEIFQYLPGTAFRNGDGNSGTYSSKYENTPDPKRSSLKFQPQFLNTRQVSRPNHMTTIERSIQASQSEAQVFNQHSPKRNSKSQRNKSQGASTQGQAQQVYASQAMPHLTRNLGQGQVNVIPPLRDSQGRPQLPHSLGQGQVKIVPPFRDSQGRPHQVWRPKQ